MTLLFKALANARSSTIVAGWGMKEITPDGKLIVTGWEDGVIRGYLPESGREKFNIPHAHNKGVTAIAVTNDSSRIVSGGGDVLRIAGDAIIVMFGGPNTPVEDAVGEACDTAHVGGL